jgi:cell volume regulation protein A
MDFLFNFLKDVISGNVAYLALPLILMTVVMIAVHTDKRSIPIILVAMFTGIIFGKDGFRFWTFDNIELANELAILALVFILFHGGFCTKKENFKIAALPGLGLATWGVILAAVSTFICLHFILGWDKNISLLISVIISSTDAPAVFAVLRKQELGHKLKSVTEVESAANDPMAILLTVVSVQALTKGGDMSYATLALLFIWKFAAGAFFGVLVAKGAAWLINKLTPQENGYYYVLMLCTALFTYGVAEEVFKASGILAVFIAGVVLGNTQFVHKQGVYNFSYTLSTIANISLLALLGVIAEPSSWFSESAYLGGHHHLYLCGIFLFLFLTFVSRPLSVFLATIGMGIKFKEKIFISWAGLRGAVPISLATYPAAAGMASGTEIFNLVYSAVLLSLVVQGLSLGKLTKLLKLSTVSRPDPPYSLEFITKDDMEAGQRLTVFTVDLPDPEGGRGPLIRDLRLPENALLLMITRRKKVSKLYRKTQKILSILGARSMRNYEETKELAAKAREMISKMEEKKYFSKDGPEDETDIWVVLPPKGDTALCGWDQITILSKIEDRDEVREILLKSFEKATHTLSVESS